MGQYGSADLCSIEKSCFVSVGVCGKFYPSGTLIRKKECEVGVKVLFEKTERGHLTAAEFDFCLCKNFFGFIECEVLLERYERLERRPCFLCHTKNLSIGCLNRGWTHADVHPFRTHALFAQIVRFGWTLTNIDFYNVFPFISILSTLAVILTSGRIVSDSS